MESKIPEFARQKVGHLMIKLMRIGRSICSFSGYTEMCNPIVHKAVVVHLAVDPMGTLSRLNEQTRWVDSVDKLDG